VTVAAGGHTDVMATHPNRLLARISGLVAPLFAAAAATAGSASAAEPVTPPPNAQFDYQIGGAYPPSATTAIVDRDRRDPPAAGRYSVCYVNAFQTQPEDAGWWRSTHPELLLRDDGGGYVGDPDWEGEDLLDTSTDATRAGLLGVVGAWIDRCAGDGFQAVEPDNLDTWTRSRGRLTQTGNAAFANLLAARAHADGLAIAQKNTPELAPQGATIGFDFAIAEECQAYGECADYSDVYGDRLYEIEYAENGGARNFAAACAARGATTSVTYRDRDVVPSGGSGYVYRWC
jgi:hypothetical protein